MPEAEHFCLGLSQKGMPNGIANLIGFVCGLTRILFVSLVIWVVTLCMLGGGVTRETEIVNQALRQGTRVTG